MITQFYFDSIMVRLMTIRIPSRILMNVVVACFLATGCATSGVGLSKKEEIKAANVTPFKSTTRSASVIKKSKEVNSDKTAKNSIISEEKKPKKQKTLQELPVTKKTVQKTKDTEKDTLKVMGWVERIKVGETESKVKAKLDSGAKTSSIHAEIIKTYKKEGYERVVYRVYVEENMEEMFDSPIIRWVRIKKKDEEGYIRRPVIKMKFCIDNTWLEDEVNLADRGQFIYPVLIGRNMLHNKIIVDSSKILTTDPQCK